MHIRHLVRKAFKVIGPDEGVASIEERLLENSFLVVLDAGAFLGLLTPADIVELPHKLVIDCLRHKPHVDSKQKIESVLKLSKESRNSVLPVFKGDKFIGVVTQGDIMDYLFEYRNGLEKEVGERTAELSRFNALLRVETTERKRVEVELRESKEHFRAIFNTAQDCIFIKDCSLKYLQVNPSMERLLGVPASELIGKTDEELFGEEVAKHIREIDSLVLKEEIVEGEHTKLIKGILRTFHHIKVPVHNPKGEIIGLCGIAREITERKRTEESLKKTQEWLRFLVSATPAMLYSCNSSPPYAATFVSENIKVLLDYEPREFIENPNFWADNIHPEDAPHIFAELSRLFETGYHAHEYRFRLKDGTYRWMHDEMNLLRDENGNPSEIFGYWIDITKRKQMEETLQISAQQWRDTFDAISDAVCLLDMEGRIQRCNTAMMKLLGKPFSEIVGRTWEHIHGPSGSIPIKGHSLIVRMQKTNRREAIVLPVHDRWLNVTLDPVLDKTGNIAGAVHVITDITEQKLAEEELKSSREQLRNLSVHLQSAREEERRHIAREIHDELGQALTALKMDITWLTNKLPEGEKPLIEKTKSISKLIDTTIQTAQKILTELRPGLLDDLGLAAAIEWQAEEFQKRTGIKCKTTLDPEEIILDQDISTAIFRIFQEALTNVSRYANATKVSVNLREKAGKLMLKVKDNGNGITKKQICDPKSFGLIGMRERVHLFGGEVKISGIRDKGTTITVDIPLGGETR